MRREMTEEERKEHGRKIREGLKRAKEKREAEEKWELVKQSINADRAGYRQVFVDE